jgi:hypothetical protein
MLKQIHSSDTIKARKPLLIKAEKVVYMILAYKEEVLFCIAKVHLKTGGTKNLLPRFIGPNSIGRVVNSYAFKIRLSAELKCYDVFNVSLLIKYNPGDDI